MNGINSGHCGRLPAEIGQGKAEFIDGHLIDVQVPGGRCRRLPLLRRRLPGPDDVLKAEPAVGIEARFQFAAGDRQFSNRRLPAGQVSAAALEANCRQAEKRLGFVELFQHDVGQMYFKIVQRRFRLFSAQINAVIRFGIDNPLRLGQVQHVSCECPEAGRPNAVEGQLSFGAERFKGDLALPAQGPAVFGVGLERIRSFAVGQGGDVIKLDVDRLNGKGGRFALPQVGDIDFAVMDRDGVEQHAGRALFLGIDVPGFRRLAVLTGWTRRQFRQIDAAVFFDDDVGCRAVDLDIPEGPRPAEQAAHL